MVATFGGFALATALAVGGPATGSPGVPTSTVHGLGDGTAHYCVADYAPNRIASVRNEQTGASTSIRTNNRGSGCTDVPIAAKCGDGAAQTIVAAGVGADGNPGTSSATVTLPEGSPACAGSSSRSGGPTRSAGPIRLTGVNIALLSVGGVALVGLVVVGIVLVRRRGVTPTA